MASFPGAVKAFTTKNAGDTIQPADVNDLQDEVNAIEAGYLNGTAPLNSSNSTLVHLSVLAGLNVVGNSTLGSTVILGGFPYIFPSSGGNVNQSLAIASTSGSTMRLEWRSQPGVGEVLLTTSDVEVTGTSSNQTNYKNIALSTPVAATSQVKVTFTYRKSTSVGNDGMSVQVKANSQIVLGPTAVLGGGSSNAFNGFAICTISQRDANNPGNAVGAANGNGAGNSGIALAPATSVSTLTTTISAIAIDAATVNGAATIAIGNVKIYEVVGA